MPSIFSHPTIHLGKDAIAPCDDQSIDPNSITRRDPTRWLMLCGVLLISSIVIATALIIDQFRERALQNSERELSNTALLLARHFDRELDDVAAVQDDIATQLQLSSPGGFAGMGTLNAHELLRAKLSGAHDVSGINLFDARGILINSSERWPVPDVSIADRAYFGTLASGETREQSAIELVQGRLSQGWSLVLSRRLNGPNGEFVGLLTRGMSPDRFEQFFASVALAKDSAVVMHHRDGTLLARHPHVEELLGKNFKTGREDQRRLFETPGLARLPSPIDGQERLVASHALTDFPLLMVVTTTVSSSLADWYRQTRFLIIVAAGSTMIIAAILFLIIRQLTRQHRATQRQLTRDKQRLSTAINNMTQGLLLFDSSARLVVCNQRYMEMYGLSAEVVKPGCSLRQILAERKAAGSFEGDIDAYCADTLSHVAARNVTVAVTPDGRSIQIATEPAPEGGWVATHEDITDRRRSEERIAYLAHYDELTSLPNRTSFRERIEDEFERVARGGTLALLYIDIDEFKAINDSLGHPVGDALLKIVAARLKACLRETDFVARLGGDEFAILQTAPRDVQEVTELVARLFETIRAPCECLGHQISTDASIGIALAPPHGTDTDQLIKNADLAMYQAKADGRRTCRFFEPRMEASAKERRTLELELRKAIADCAFEIYYQPIVELRNGDVIGCEALLRWRHPQRGMISPAKFIPVAEATGLINELGEWVLRTACAEAANWPAEMSVAVNVSPVQFKSRTLPLKVAAALAASGLPASRLELEITEAVLIDDDETALSVLHELKTLGVRIALDDFGTGYSSLSYLQRFPFDKIKIDRCFIDGIARPDGASAIVQAVVNIATARHMTTTAEGVETAEQRDLLRGLGCTHMQGYLFSPAIAPDTVRQLFAGGGNAAGSRRSRADRARR
ncbi:bifunctional diguanylate cyclase/phosphodiesterase [Rhodopseudomonas palustris]|uniref:Diguanylate cyclase/phosphodiesterase n=1 Tax=Rhodopseudomonas palustris (strain BisB18) TaxID=316056 RepID=Q20XI9_RHOPB